MRTSLYCNIPRSKNTEWKKCDFELQKTSISLLWLNTRDSVELDNELDYHQDWLKQVLNLSNQFFSLEDKDYVLLIKSFYPCHD